MGKSLRALKMEGRGEIVKAVMSGDTNGLRRLMRLTVHHAREARRSRRKCSSQLCAGDNRDSRHGLLGESGGPVEPSSSGEVLSNEGAHPLKSRRKFR
jgi:hypothetical protein